MVKWKLNLYLIVNAYSGFCPQIKIIKRYFSDLLAVYHVGYPKILWSYMNHPTATMLDWMEIPVVTREDVVNSTVATVGKIHRFASSAEYECQNENIDNCEWIIPMFAPRKQYMKN